VIALAGRCSYCEAIRSDVAPIEVSEIIQSLATRFATEVEEGDGLTMLGFFACIDGGPTATVAIMRNLTHAEWRAAVADVGGPPLR